MTDSIESRGSVRPSGENYGVLVAHNYYLQPGGEDQVFHAEMALLRGRGHRVVRYALSNTALSGMSSVEALRRSVWNTAAIRDLAQLVSREGPRVAHLHNTLPLISPAAYYAAKAARLAVVQTLHNYRMFCSNGLFYRDGSVCERCAPLPGPWLGVRHGCYRSSRTASAAVATLTAVHRIMRTWLRKVDAYIATTEFSRQKFIEYGLAPDKIFVKPNFLERDPGQADADGRCGALFVGRLSHEKGVATLLRAVTALEGAVPTSIVGDGPVAPLVESAAAECEWLRWLGHRPRDAVDDLMGKAAFMVVPSQCYESFPLVVVEAFARGTPIIASKLGSLSELITHHRTGLHFEPGDSEDLARQMKWATAHPRELAEMGRNARVEFERKYTAERNYEMLVDIYDQAIAASDSP